MEDVESDDAGRNRSGPGEPIREANTATNEEDAKLVYDHTRFGGIRLGIVTFTTIMGTRSLSRGGQHGGV
jgi:hypothetical protein